MNFKKSILSTFVVGSMISVSSYAVTADELEPRVADLESQINNKAEQSALEAVLQTTQTVTTQLAETMRDSLVELDNAKADKTALEATDALLADTRTLALLNADILGDTVADVTKLQDQIKNKASIEYVNEQVGINRTALAEKASKEELATVETKADNVQVTADLVKVRVEALEDAVTANTESINDLTVNKVDKSEYDTFKDATVGYLAGVDDFMTAVDESLTILDNDLTAAEAKIADLESNKADKSELDAKADKARVDYLRELVITNGQSISKVDAAAAKAQTAANDAQTTADEALAGLDGKADKSTVAALENTVATKADQAAVDTLAKVVDTKADKTTLDEKADKTTVNALETVVATKADQATVDALATAVDTIASSSDVVALSKTVATKADKSTVDALDKRVSNNTARIEELNDDLRNGLANQAALSGLFQPYNVGKVNVSVAVGGYKSSSAIAIGSGYRLNENIATKAGLAFNTNGGGASYHAGVNFEW